jgi:hypothetical protein
MAHGLLRPLVWRGRIGEAGEGLVRGHGLLWRRIARSAISVIWRCSAKEAVMRKAQVFLTDEQLAELRRIARETGRKQSEIIRRGVDLAVKEAKEAPVADWKSGILSAAGIWKDRDDLDELYADLRRRNLDRLNRLIGE